VRDIVADMRKLFYELYRATITTIKPAKLVKQSFLINGRARRDTKPDRQGRRPKYDFLNLVEKRRDEPLRSRPLLRTENDVAAAVGKDTHPGCLSRKRSPLPEDHRRYHDGRSRYILGAIDLLKAPREPARKKLSSGWPSTGRKRRERAELTGGARAAGIECASHSEKISDGPALAQVSHLQRFPS
jgi:hypothetical protein